MEKRKINVKMSLSYSEVVAYLEDLLKSFKSRKIVVQTGEDHLVMTPPEQVGVKVEAKIKKDRQSIGFELSWVQCEPGGLSISDREPEPLAARAEPQAVPAMPRKATGDQAAKESAKEKKEEKKHGKKEAEKEAEKEKKDSSGKAKPLNPHSTEPRG
jgi:amphi-Trp domain-containing protein